MKHIMKLNEQPFKMIQSENKSIELRLYDEKRRLVSVGDEIEFFCASDNEMRILSRVVAMHTFSSFKELYEGLPLLKCGYTVKDVANASYKDMLEYYTAEEEKAFGVVGIEIEILK